MVEGNVHPYGGRMRSFRALTRFAAAITASAIMAMGPSSPVSAQPIEIAARPAEVPALGAADLEPWLDGFLPEALNANRVAGASVAVVKDGQVILSKGYGYADVAKQLPIDPNRTTFRPASISKLFVVTALMQQVEEGKVSLDENINTYLDFTVDGKDNAPISVRHLITHTAGFEESLQGKTYSDASRLIPLATFVKQEIPNRIFAPGSTPAYSNYGMALAGYIIERVSGLSFDDYMDRRIFTPLGMTSSSFRQPIPAPLLEASSRGYVDSVSKPIATEYINDAPAGSLTATPSDMAKFMIEHLQNEQPGKGVLLKPATAKEMHRTITRKFPDLNGMALGFYEANRNGRRVIRHSGDLNAFHSDLNLFLDDNVGVFISMNSAGVGATDIRQRLMTLFADRYFPDASSGKQAPRIDAATARKHAQEVAGQYKMSRSATTTFVKIGNLVQSLTLTPQDDGSVTAVLGPISHRLTEVEPYLWQELGTDVKLQAKKEPDGSWIMALSDYSPVIVFIQTTGSDSPAFIKPTVGLSLLVLLLTLVAWPVAALVRRRYRVAADWREGEVLSVRARRLGSIALLVPAILWIFGIILPFVGGTPPDDSLLTGVQISTIIGVVVAAVALAVSLIHTARKSRSIFRWITSLTWTIAVAFVIFQFYNFNLLDLSTNY
jgi:CubicO group peptidase (beta-lactamase class C family)